MAYLYYLDVVVRDVTVVAGISVTRMLEDLSISDVVGADNVPGDTDEETFLGWRVSLGNSVSDEVLDSAASMKDMLDALMRAGGDPTISDGETVTLTAVFKENTSTGGGGSVSDTAKKYVDPEAAQELVKKIEALVGAIASLPSSTASDSGKFLTVNSSGKAEWTTVPSASGVSF